MNAQTLASRIATTPGLFQKGPTWFDGTIRLPLKPLYLENAYASPELLRDLGRAGLEAVHASNADVVAGTEAAGIPLATAIALVGDVDLAYVRKPGYLGHVSDEPTTRGADVQGRKVLIVDDAVWRGLSLRASARYIRELGGEVAGVFCLVDMRDLAPGYWGGTGPDNCGLHSFFACATYRELLHYALVGGVLDRRTHDLVLSCIDEHWTNEDPRWQELERYTLRAA